MNSTNSNKNRVEHFFASLNSGNVDAVVDTYAENGYVQTMGHTLISGKSFKAQIRSAVSGIYDVFPKGLTFEILGMIGEDEKVTDILCAGQRPPFFS